MLFLDELLKHPGLSSVAQQVLGSAVVLDGFPVTQYYYEETAQEHWFWRDFPNVAPPFKDFWIDSRAAHHINSEEAGFHSWDYRRYPEAWGMYCIAEDLISEEDRRAALALSAPSYIWVFEPYLAQARWQVDWYLYQKWYARSFDTEPFWFWRLLIAEDGSVIMRKPEDAVLVSGPASQKSRRDFDLLAALKGREAVTGEMHNGAMPFLHQALLTVSFLHCKNVVLHDVVPPLRRVHNRSQKKRGEKDYQPLAHKVIDIHPMKEVLRREGRSETVGIQRAMHICRGHFATYSTEKPLFGKHSGTFWRPMHVRGASADQQPTAASYKVHPK